MPYHIPLRTTVLHRPKIPKATASQLHADLPCARVPLMSSHLGDRGFWSSEIRRHPNMYCSILKPLLNIPALKPNLKPEARDNAHPRSLVGPLRGLHIPMDLNKLKDNLREQKLSNDINHYTVKPLNTCVKLCMGTTASANSAQHTSLLILSWHVPYDQDMFDHRTCFCWVQTAQS